MINVGIIGAAGYSGVELIKLLLNHDEVIITKLFGNSSAGSLIEESHPSLRGMIWRSRSAVCCNAFRTINASY